MGDKGSHWHIHLSRVLSLSCSLLRAIPPRELSNSTGIVPALLIIKEELDLQCCEVVCPPEQPEKSYTLRAKQQTLKTVTSRGASSIHISASKSLEIRQFLNQLKS